MSLTIQKVTRTDVPTLAKVAEGIWHEYFTPIIGTQQVEYMVEKFQSVNGITNQLDNGYEYYFAIYDDEIVIFRNEFGKFLAIKLLSVDSRSHGKEKDVMTFEYTIIKENI